MTPPRKAKIFEGELATFWFDEYGILCAVAKKVPRTLQKQEENFGFIRQITGNKRVCMLSDSTLAAQPDADTRAYMEVELPYLFKAMATLSHTDEGEMIVQSFLLLNNAYLPMRLFNPADEKEARQWLRQYL